MTGGMSSGLWVDVFMFVLDSFVSAGNETLFSVFIPSAVCM